MAPEPHISVHTSRERPTGFSQNSSDMGDQRNGEYLELHSPLAVIWSYVLGLHKCSLSGHFGLWLRALQLCGAR